MFYILLAIPALIIIFPIIEIFTAKNDSDKDLAAFMVIMIIIMTAVVVGIPFAFTQYRANVSLPTDMGQLQRKFNLNIQQQESYNTKLLAILKQYPQYEQAVMTNAKPTGQTFLAAGELYPELKADKFYQEQVSLLKPLVDQENDLRKQELDFESEVNSIQWWLPGVSITPKSSNIQLLDK